MSPVDPLPRGEPVDPRVALPPARRPLAGPHIALEPVVPARDADELYAASHGSPEIEALWTYMGYGPFADATAMQAWLEACAASEDPLFFTVVDRADDARVGMTSFLRVDRSSRVLELGNIWYAPSHQRGRANPEAVWLMLRHAFDDLGYRRVEWKCDALNARSRAAAERLGFRFEGVFAKHLIVKGRNRDTAWYALLDDDWPAAKEALEARLRP